jgi:hypothetical protein
MRAPFLLAFKDKMASSHTIVQSIVDDQKRGRVLSLSVMARRGIESLGSLVFGAIGAWVGTPGTPCLLRWRLSRLDFADAASWKLLW